MALKVSNKNRKSVDATIAKIVEQLDGPEEKFVDKPIRSDSTISTILVICLVAAFFII